MAKKKFHLKVNDMLTSIIVATLLIQNLAIVEFSYLKDNVLT